MIPQQKNLKMLKAQRNKDSLVSQNKDGLISQNISNTTTTQNLSINNVSTNQTSQSVPSPSDSSDEKEKKKQKLKNLVENLQPIQKEKTKVEKEKSETTKEIEKLKYEISQLSQNIDLPKFNFNESYYKVCKKSKLKRVTVYDVMDQVQIYCKEKFPNEPEKAKKIGEKIYERHQNKHKGLYEIQLKTVSKKSKISLQKKKEEFVKI